MSFYPRLVLVLNLSVVKPQILFILVKNRLLLVCLILNFVQTFVLYFSLSILFVSDLIYFNVGIWGYYTN